jgi:hypothetical protein
MWSARAPPTASTTRTGCCGSARRRPVRPAIWTPPPPPRSSGFARRYRPERFTRRCSHPDPPPSPRRSGRGGAGRMPARRCSSAAIAASRRSSTGLVVGLSNNALMVRAACVTVGTVRRQLSLARPHRPDYSAPQARETRPHGVDLSQRPSLSRGAARDDRDLDLFGRVVVAAFCVFNE